MSIAAHAARFSAQLGFELGFELGPAPQGPAVPTGTPAHAALVRAALQNESVRSFIADGVPTWTRERVERSPPCCLVYEHGEVVGSVEDLPAMVRHAEKRGGLGRRLGVRALKPGEEVLAYHIGVRWGPTHPRRYRWEQRMALKSLLPRGDRVAVRYAMRKSQRSFLAWADTRPGLAERVATATGLSLPAFWRTVRGRTW